MATSSCLFPILRFGNQVEMMSRWSRFLETTADIARMPPFAVDIAAPSTPASISTPTQAGTWWMATSGKTRNESMPSSVRDQRVGEDADERGRDDRDQRHGRAPVRAAGGGPAVPRGEDALHEVERDQVAEPSERIAAQLISAPLSLSVMPVKSV